MADLFGNYEGSFRLRRVLAASPRAVEAVYRITA
jgi:hypothetical protein